MLKRVAPFVTLSIVVCTATLGVLLGFARHTRSRAELLLRDITQLQLGTATFIDAQKLATEFGGKPWSGPLERAACSAQSCNLRFMFDNKSISRVLPVRKVQFVVGIAIREGHLVSRELEFSTLTASYTAFSYVLTDGMTFMHGRDYEIKRLKVDAIGTPHLIVVHLGNLVTEHERRQAYAINLTCLASLSCCSDATAVFPEWGGQ